MNVGFDDLVDLTQISAPPHPDGEVLFPSLLSFLFVFLISHTFFQKLFPEDEQGGGPSVNPEWVANLAAMGFEAEVCEHAIEETGNAGWAYYIIFYIPFILGQLNFLA